MDISIGDTDLIKCPQQRTLFRGTICSYNQFELMKMKTLIGDMTFISEKGELCYFAWIRAQRWNETAFTEILIGTCQELLNREGENWKVTQNWKLTQQAVDMHF